MNQLLTKPQAKTKPKQYVDTNPVEALLNLSSSVKDSFANDLAKPLKGDFINQLLGFGDKKNDHTSESSSASGDLQPGIELDMRSLERKKKEHMSAAPGIDYHREIVHSERKIHAENQQELQQKMQEIVIELKKLTDSSKELQIQFKDVAITQRVIKPGKYHVNFFEWVLATIRQARAKVEDSAHWMQALSKKGNKKSYWGMFKQHGTSFGMSNERQVATQAG